MKEINDHDRQLVEIAHRYPSNAWDAIDELIERAETDEGRERLRSIQNYLYHRDEYLAGLD